MGAITKPRPIPIQIQATNMRGDVLRKINPIPRPISVVPPMAQELLSVFLLVIIY